MTENQDPSDPFKREGLGTSLLDAQPEEIVRFASDSYLPLVLALALALFFVGVLTNQLWLPAIGIIVGIASMIAMLAPQRQVEEAR